LAVRLRVEWSLRLMQRRRQRHQWGGAAGINCSTASRQALLMGVGVINTRRLPGCIR
jgi:hypothetical protein